MKIQQRFSSYIAATLMLTVVGYTSALSVPLRHEAVARPPAPASILIVPAAATDEINIATLDITGRGR